jgi:diadenosine tetraphosphate (Ap4A) HIT family hydrolase
VAVRRVSWDSEGYLRLVRRACFVCELVAGNPDYAHHVVHRDEAAVVFLNRYPLWVGHLLVAPTAHREQVVSDATCAEYLAVQKVVYAAGRALGECVPTERLYVLSLGSQQGNRHVHWHLVPLPPGVAYDQQQVAALSTDQGWLDIPPAEQADLAGRLADRLPAYLVQDP